MPRRPTECLAKLGIALFCTFLATLRPELPQCQLLSPGLGLGRHQEHRVSVRSPSPVVGVGELEEKEEEEEEDLMTSSTVVSSDTRSAL